MLQNSTQHVCLNRLAVLASATVWMAASGAVFGGQEPITVVIFDQVGMADSTFKKAADTSRKIFGAAGVETNWILCRVPGVSNEPCPIPPPGTYLEAIIVPKRADRARSGDDLGFALINSGVPTVTFYAFSEPVKTLAARAEESVALVLGCVMAHEIGHLAGLQHGPYGVMKAEFGRHEIFDAAVDHLNFSPQDAKVLRAFAGHRLNLTASVVH